MKRCVRVLSTFQLLLNYFERFLSAAHDHHSTECCSAEKEEQNAGVDGGAREITAPGCTKIGIIVIACCCCPVARIINRAAREIRVSTRKLVPDITVALQVWPRIECVDNANRTEARKYNLNFFITMLFQRAKTKAMVRKDFMAKWFSEK